MLVSSKSRHSDARAAALKRRLVEANSKDTKLRKISSMFTTLATPNQSPTPPLSHAQPPPPAQSPVPTPQPPLTSHLPVQQPTQSPLPQSPRPKSPPLQPINAVECVSVSIPQAIPSGA
eukprot:2385270-Prymnesium_polylepis.1